MFARLLFCFAFLFGAVGVAHADTTPTTRDGSHDFDFFFGRWTGVQHKLKHRLANSNEWEDFESFSVVRPLLGGRANTDTVVLKGEKSVTGVTFRTYDPTKRQWSIYWVTPQSTTLDTPVVGGFVDGIGTFYGDDTWDGKPIRVRFIWSHIDLTHARWEQAFSTDAGKTWETNWVANFTRSSF